LPVPGRRRPIRWCVQNAQPLAIGGGILNTAENKASRPKQPGKIVRFRVPKTLQNKE
jgi:hypothetical protein